MQPTFFNDASEVPQCPDPEVTSSLLAKELSQMSIQEREKVFSDIHGVAEIPSEEPAFISECLINLQQEIDKIPSKVAYDYANSIAPGYVQGRKLRLMFLRANEFDAVNAAKSIVTFFEYKKLWFGIGRIGRPIEIADLDDDDMAVLNSGFMQLLPFRDKAGRPVLWTVQKYLEFKSIENVFRVAWFIHMKIADDEETQKRGFVVVNYMSSTSIDDTRLRDAMWMSARFLSFMPSRIVACHFCLDSSIPLPLVALLRLGSATHFRSRTRIYQGTDTEMTYKLMTFGVPVHYAPVTYDGVLKTKTHRQWVQKYQIKGSSCRNDKDDGIVRIDLPGRYDILIGKGVPFQQHTGNVWYHEIVDGQKDLYLAATPTQKKQMLKDILQSLKQQNNARFLQRDSDGWWVEVSDEVARQKIAYRLRSKSVVRTPKDHNQEYNNNNNNNCNDNAFSAPFITSNQIGLDCLCHPGTTRARKKARTNGPLKKRENRK